MKISELLTNYVNKEEKERTIGHYYASEINSIIKGYLTVSNFKTKKPILGEGVNKIISGIAFEEMLEKIFIQQKVDHKYNERYEIKVSEGVTITCKPDFEFPDRVWETKYCFDKDWDYIMSTYQYQLECEHRVTGKDVYVALFSSPFNIQVKKFIPSEVRWETTKKVVLDFHNKLIKKYNK